MKSRSWCLSFPVLVSVALAGCLSLEKSYPEKRYFALSTSRPGPRLTAPFDGVLAIRPVRISPVYDGSEFVYKTGDVTFESDFYNEFFIPPSRLITQEVRRWFEASGLFQTVVDSASPIESTHALEGAVQAIYGEYRPGAPPRAVLETQFFLIATTGQEVDILLQQSFSRKVEIPDDTAAALVRGWNDALGEILTELERELQDRLAARSTNARSALPHPGKPQQLAARLVHR